jgi:hypothetical protein
VDYAMIVKHASLVVDTRNATRAAGAPHVVRLSGGRPRAAASEHRVPSPG